MTPRHVRTLRGAVAASTATVIAAASHTLAGGGAPAAALVGVMAVLAWPVATVAVGRRLSAWRVAAAVLASQLLFHVAFAFTAGIDTSVVTGHVHHASLAGAAGIAAVIPDAPMTVGHLIAAALTMAGMYGGERMLRALGRGIRSILRRPAFSGSPLRPTRALVTGARVLAAASATALSDLSRRGPPVVVDAAI